VLSGGIGEVGMCIFAFTVPENAFLARVISNQLTAAAAN
jgi:hypothetical protein